MSLETDVNVVKTDASKVASTVTADAKKVDTVVKTDVADVVSFWDSTHTTKVLLIVAGIAFVLGFLVTKL